MLIFCLLSSYSETPTRQKKIDPFSLISIFLATNYLDLSSFVIEVDLRALDSISLLRYAVAMQSAISLPVFVFRAFTAF